jgi:Zn-dependent protease with chaperone function
LILKCKRCGIGTQEDLGFCLNCGLRLIPQTKYDLIPSDFAYPPDLRAIETVKATGALPYLLKKLTLGDFEKTLSSKLHAEAHQVTYPSYINMLERRSAELLSIDFLPEMFILESGQPNAFTFGTEEQAYLVLDSSLPEILTEPELTAVIAHELGHVKSGHMMYHTLAEVLGGGISLSASFFGLDLISIPVRLALLSWYRESEVSADRAGLLAVNDINIMSSLFPKLASGHKAASLNQSQMKTQDVGILETVGGLFRTHPLDINRFKLANEFWKSDEFRRTRQKIELRQRLLKALVPTCRYCAHPKSPEALFCPECGKCQT